MLDDYVSDEFETNRRIDACPEVTIERVLFVKAMKPRQSTSSLILATHRFERLFAHAEVFFARRRTRVALVR